MTNGYFTIIIILLLCPANFSQVDYTPNSGGDWEVSTPQEQGVDPELLIDLYQDAAELDKIKSILIIKNGYLIAEGYFNDGAIDHHNLLASVTKSITSALIGIALREGYLQSPDQKILDFFPELKGSITDPRKEKITIRHLLQMRAGYPWEETDTTYWNGLLSGYYVPCIESYPLLDEPGSQFNYSNLSTNVLGLIIPRASGLDLLSFANKYLFEPMGIEPGKWGTDAEGNYVGCADLHLRSRDLAKFGLMYLNGGVFNGKQIVPAEWVSESLESYSDDAWVSNDVIDYIGNYFRDLGYGYQWWSAAVGDYTFDYGAGHGGQLIILLPKYNMVIAQTSHPFYLVHNDTAWKYELESYDLIGRFILALSEPDVIPPKTGLHEAVVQGNLEAVKGHIAAGTDINFPDVFGSTPLIIAATFGHTDIALALIDAGAELDIQNKDGSTALITAAFFCRKEIVEALLEKGADKTIKNSSGATAYGTVVGPYPFLKPFYEQIEKDLAPFGLVLDYDYIEKTRPVIADLLK